MTFAETPEAVDVDTQSRIRPGTVAQKEKQCPKCGKWVGVGSNGGLYTFHAHLDSQVCLRAVERKARARREAPAIPATNASFGPPILPPPPVSTSPDVTMSETSPLNQPSPILPEQAPCIPPTISNTAASHTLQTTPPQILTTSKVPCPGVRLKWVCKHPARTYPFQSHDAGNLTWFATAAGPHDPDYIYLRSTSCNLFCDPFQEACSECIKVPSSTQFQSLVQRALKDPAPSTPHIFLSWEQLSCKARDKAHECHQLRKKRDGALHKISRFTQRVDDYERLFFHIAIADYKNVSQVLQVAMKNGSSPAAVISKLQLAIEKKYTPRPGTDEFALDLGCLVKAIGGPKLLFALNRALALPSYRTIGRHRKVPQLIPSTLAPSLEDASTNISTFFSQEERPLSTFAGHSLLIDGVALEEKCRYLRSSDSVIGLCREHAGGLDLRVRSAESILAIEEAVHAEKPRAHYSSEATVAAIAPFQSSNYSAIPFILSGSCKAETGEGMAKWVTNIIHAWNGNPDGAATRGPIWSLATDGESTMRMCRFILCMSHKLPVTDPLYISLQNLPGLNLFTGVNGITMTCDPKHIFKRFATLLRAREGILVNKSVVNKNHLRSHLVQLPGANSSTVEALVDPADKQNVPKAVALVQSLDQLKALNTSHYNPSQINEHQSLTAVGEIFSSFMDPFITVTMSLSDQLISLSKYAHAAFAVYSKHSTDFMTSALYADSQAIVKDVFFCIAKQKLLDPQANFYIIHCGTDRLETDFCLARTQTHHRNFDILDLAGKLATSSLIDCIYARNPALDTGSRRLKVSGAIGIDHLNPTSWIGDVNVDKVSLQLCWEAGRKQAAALISLIYPGDPVVNFCTTFRLADCDLLRPAGRYVGFSGEADFSIMDDQPDVRVATKLHSNVLQPIANITGDLESDSDREDDEGFRDDEDDRNGGDLEDLLPDSTDEPIDGFNSSTKDWLEINGQDYLKASLISQHLKANRSKKVVERTLRVRGLTLDDLRKRPPETSLDPNGDNFQVGDLAATLVRTGSFVCLVILQAIGIRKDQRTQHVIKIETLHNPKEEYFVQGEVLQVIQAGPDMWLWPSHDFLKVSKPKKSRHTKSSVRDFTLSVRGSLCYHVNPGVHPIPRQHLPPGSSDPAPPVQDNQTWSFLTLDLQNLLQLAWSDLQPEDPQDLDEKIKLLPRVWGSFPYTDNSGVAAFVVEVPSSELPSANIDKETKQRCPLCHEEKKLKELRGHIGLHILWCSLGIEEDLMEKVGNNPCGFCGGNLCSTHLVTDGGKREVESNCRLRCPFKYGAAQKSTKNSPCTNVPINCPHCSETVWKYNAVDHITFRHKVLLSGAGLDPHFVLEIQPGKDEELMMGIPNNLVIDYHARYPGLFPKGEDLIAIKGKVQGTQKPAKRRYSQVESTSLSKKRRQ